MASVVVSSTSASTSPTSTTATVARSDEGNADREDPVGAASIGLGDGTISIDVQNSGPNTVDFDCHASSLIDNDENDGQNQHEQDRMQNSLSLSEKIRSNQTIEVGNEYNKKKSSFSSPTLGSNSDPAIPGRTVATSGKGFGEGPLPRELRRIIMEVAKTGKCSWLSWNQETTTLTTKRKGNGSHPSTPARSNCTPGNVQMSAVVSKSPSLSKVSSSSPSQYSTSFTNTGTSGGIVRNKSSCIAGTGVTRRSTGISPRKRHRNGVVHKGGERMRFGNPDGAFGRSDSSSNSRKRPLVFVRTNNTNTNCTSSNNGGNNNSSSSNNIINSSSKLNINTANAASSSSATPGGFYSSTPSSVGSGRSTGSEPDYDSTQYECDSEGTSATTNSEISVRKTTRAKRSGAANTQGAQINSGLDTWTDTATICDGEDEANSVDGNNAIPGSPYKTLQTAFRGALGLVLDHFYQNRDNGYKLSPAEKRRNERFAETLSRNGDNNSTDDRDSTMKSDKLSSLLSSEYIFQQRRQRLMAMLLPTISQAGHEIQSEEPPFTIQRIAEVLVAPDRYYTQTHKLCNCLEKLLLVNSSTASFGGSTGGDTSQQRREERELAALADEKGRQEIKLRQCRLLINKSPIDEFLRDDNLEPFSMSRGCPNNFQISDESDVQNPSSKAKSGSLDVRSDKETLATNIQSTYPSQKLNATSLPDSSTSREKLEALSRTSLRTKFEHVGTETQHGVPNPANKRDFRSMAENRRMTNSPPLSDVNLASGVASGPGVSVPSHGHTNGFVRQHLSEQQQNEGHDLVARVTSPILFSPGTEPNLEATSNNMNMVQFHHAVTLAGVSLNRPNNSSPLDTLMTLDASTISQIRSQSNTTGTGPGSESTDGRSSASNSDIDSESDDISFDDSASDRSDGSDSGSTSAYHEPFTAARAMALNRIQQQQRLQSRVLTSLGTSHQGEYFRPPLDSEYQSGDSIDSTRAEDSGGSDSSSSELAD